MPMAATSAVSRKKTGSRRSTIGRVNQTHSITAAPMTYRDQGRSVGRNRFKSPQHRDTDTSIAVSRMAASRLEAGCTAAELAGK